MSRKLLVFFLLFYSASGFSQLPFNAVVLGDNVSFRDDSTSNAHISAYLKTGDLCSIVSTSVKREINIEQGTVCEGIGYLWYKVKLKNGKSGWVSGRNILLLDDASMTTLGLSAFQGKKYTFGKDEFVFCFAKDASLLVSKSNNGMSGCEDLYYPFFYSEKNGNVYFVQAPQKCGYTPLDVSRSEENRFWVIRVEQNAIEMMLGIEMKKGGMIVRLKHTGGEQEGDFSAEIELNNNSFSIISMNK
ncbi:MAG: SH3 domain-containing protein [Bacteroidetes bacterium]|nr:SH3 domain-containing protein [Bacteroidota bacterium]MBU1719936.1 SH3 domain-containing protein [Bacteroidota bacterium]